MGTWRRRAALRYCPKAEAVMPSLFGVAAWRALKVEARVP
jgi:hypothetical protein